MNIRRAKREACWRAAGMVRGTLEGGYDLDDLDEADRAKVYEQIMIVVEELERRGHL